MDQKFVAEAAVKILRGRYRTLKLQLEHQISGSIPPPHALSAWLLEHAASILNIRIRGSDGKTPWQRETSKVEQTVIYLLARR